VKILFNATTNHTGGPVQTAVNFIRQNQLFPCPNIDWFYAISSKIKQELFSIDINIPNLYVFPFSPAKNWSARNSLINLAQKIRPDVIFTMSGPAYVEFNQPHVLGCSNPFVTHPNEYALESLGGVLQKSIFRANISYKRFWFKKADYWVFQTSVSRDGFISKIKTPIERTIVVPNALSDLYQIDSSEEELNAKSLDSVCTRILVPSAYYKHKNLEIIPYVADELRRDPKCKNTFFKFILTIPDSKFKTLKNSAISLNVVENIENRGVFSIVDGPSLYQSCNLMFLPTLLETFSASYLESMGMSIPIVTSDLDFARGICGEAAVYFSPKSTKEAAEAISTLIRSRELRNKLITLGKTQLKKYPTIADRHRILIDFLRNL